MARNNGYQRIIEERRRRVASLLLRGLTQREITDQLGEKGFVNPKTHKPYDLAQINRDIKALSQEWQVSAARDIIEHKAEQLAEIKEAKRLCWASRDLTNLVKFIKLEMDLLGTLAPTKIEIDWRAELVALGFNPQDAFEDYVNELEQRFAALNAE